MSYKFSQEIDTKLTKKQLDDYKDWSNGEYKCPDCNIVIGKNLLNEIPFYLVEKHKQSHN